MGKDDMITECRGRNLPTDGLLKPALLNQLREELTEGYSASRHFLENEYGDLSFFLYVKQIWANCQCWSRNWIVENVNLASNRDYNHGTNIKIYME